MRLSPGSPIPLFVRKDIYGRTIDLNEFRDQKVLIAFFRHAGCPFCNLRVHALTKAYPDLLQQGLRMIFFFESKESVLLRSTFHQGVSPIPLISDPEKELYGRYGLEPSARGSAVSHLTTFIPSVIAAKAQGLPVHLMKDGESISTMPAEFLVSPGLRLFKALYARNLTERIDMEELGTFAKSA